MDSSKNFVRFALICKYFETKQVQFVDEEARLHLLVNYPFEAAI